MTPRSPITVIAACFAAVFAHATAQESPALHPIAQAAADTLADPDSPFVMIVTFRIDEAKAGAFLAAMEEPRAETVKEPGNLAYALSRSATDPEVFFLYEHWKSVADLESHLNQPYLVRLGEALEAIRDEPPKLDFFTPVP